jgi:predicted transcriptional regulator
MSIKNRSRTDIIAQIVQSAQAGSITKIKMMYKTFLSHTQLKEYLVILIENALLDYNQIDRTYKATEKGLRFLKIYEKMSDIVSVPHNNTYHLY